MRSRRAGAPLEKEIAAVQRCAHGDALILAAIESIPRETRDRGAPTEAQLRDRFAQVRACASNVSLLPHGGRGLFAHTLAWFASTLRLREESPIVAAGQLPVAAASVSERSAESTLALAESLLSDGRLMDAVEVMEEGFRDSAASEIIKDWIAEAKLCSSIDAILELSRAHSMVQNTKIM